MPHSQSHREAGALASSLLTRCMVTLGALTLAAPNGGCEVAVPDTLPAFRCVPGPDTCPSDTVCAPATEKCVARSQACTLQGCPSGAICDRETLACTAGSTDSGSFASCSALGCSCSGPSDCASGICGDELTVTLSVYNVAKANFCTKPCCTSSDCDGSTVCFATGVGGNYCVRPEWLGRQTTLGSALGGASCNGDSDCGSGLCVGTACADTCCSTAHSSSECSSGAACGFGTFPGKTFDTHYAAYCATPVGQGTNGSACTSNSECLGSLCAAQGVARVCRDACRNSADCGSSSQECGYSIPVSAVVTSCSPAPGTVAEGGTCHVYTDCQSGFCDSSSNRCTDVCFADSDCAGVNGWRCRPEVVVFFGASFSFLACGS